MVVTSTKGKSGSFTRFVSNIGANVKAAFSGNKGGTSVINTPSGKMLVPSGSTSGGSASSGGGLVDGYYGSGGGSSSSGSSSQRVESSRADIQRQQALASSKPSSTIQKPSATLKQNPTESKASFQARQQSVDRAYNQLYSSNQFNQRPNESESSYKNRLNRAGIETEERTSSLSSAGFERSGVVSAAEQPKGILNRLQSSITREKERQSQRGSGIKSGAYSFGLGVASSAVGTVQFGKSLVVNPIKTTKETGKSILGIAKNPKGVGLKIGEELKRNPSYTIGFAATEIATAKGLPKAPGKISDVLRTTKLEQVSETKIIAPEYFKGQKYPAIVRGQTAGQLKSEFKPLLPGETKPAGFTASPKPIKGNIQKGTSELPGLYQAPKLSPTFLRVGGETNKLFSLRPFEPLKPTISRITPSEFELVPGVSSGQKSIAPLKPAKQFFETAPKGKSYVPFIKTEKEAVIPFGTELKQKPTRFFISYENRKIPIQEFETISETKTTIKEPKTTASRDLFKKTSSSYNKSKGAITPLDISSAGKLASSRKTKGVSSRIISKGSRSSLSIKPSSSSFSRNLRGSRATRRSSSSGFFPSSSSSFLSSSSKFIKGRTTRTTQTFDFSLPKSPFKSNKKKSKPPKRLPSLFAIGRGIKSSSKGIGESSGLTIRPILTSNKKKSKRKR